MVNNKPPHKGDERLFFDLANTETVCKADHDTAIQREEARGCPIEPDIGGQPLDPAHPWNGG